RKSPRRHPPDRARLLRDEGGTGGQELEVSCGSFTTETQRSQRSLSVLGGLCGDGSWQRTPSEEELASSPARFATRFHRSITHRPCCSAMESDEAAQRLLAAGARDVFSDYRQRERVLDAMLRSAR